MGTQQGWISDIGQLANGSFIGVGAIVTNSPSVTSWAIPLIYSLHFNFTLNSSIPYFWNQFDRASSINFFSTVNVVNNGTEYVTCGVLDTLGEYFPPYKINSTLRFSSFTSAGVAIQNRYHDYPYFSNPSKPYFSNLFYANHVGVTDDGGLIAAIKIDNQTMSVPFYVVKWDANGCDTSLAYCMNPTGLITENNNGSIHIYPTPATSYLMVEKQSEIIQQADLVDQSGRSVRRFELSQSLTKLNLSGISPGLYLLKMYEAGRQTQVLKVVVE